MTIKDVADRIRLLARFDLAVASLENGNAEAMRRKITRTQLERAKAELRGAAP